MDDFSLITWRIFFIRYVKDYGGLYETHQSQPEISAVKAISPMEMEDAEVMNLMDFHAAS